MKPSLSIFAAASLLLLNATCAIELNVNDPGILSTFKYRLIYINIISFNQKCSQNCRGGAEDMVHR
jgi:hypothetical protein